jgi:CxxC-x17-CxxC domain-containing protein
MSFQDKTLQCADCGQDFTFSAEEQEFFQSKGYVNEPKRCQECRRARKTRNEGNSGYSSGPRQMYSVVCAECGAETEVPFQPRGDRPVYCRDCYRKIRN